MRLTNASRACVRRRTVWSPAPAARSRVVRPRHTSVGASLAGRAAEARWDAAEEVERANEGMYLRAGFVHQSHLGPACQVELAPGLPQTLTAEEDLPNTLASPAGGDGDGEELFPHSHL